MSGMDAFLAEHYGTNKTAAANEEDLEKQAMAELFVKLAGEQNIDLDNMPEEKVQALYDGWVEKSAQMQNGAGQTQKTAAEDKKDEKDEHEEKREEAEKEHEEKKATAEKLAEADFLGRVMAHAYAQELQKIAAAQSGETEEPAEGAEKAAAMPEALRKGLEAARGGAKRGKELLTGSKIKEHVKNEASAHPAVKHFHMDAAMNEGRKVTKARIGAGAAGVAAVGGGAAAAHHKSKKASAIDALAADHAVALAHHYGFDAEEAGRKVAAVLELGLLGESEKIAAAPDVDTAVGIRALELLEAGGYPVTWNQ